MMIFWLRNIVVTLHYSNAFGKMKDAFQGNKNRNRCSDFYLQWRLYRYLQAARAVFQAAVAASLAVFQVPVAASFAVFQAVWAAIRAAFRSEAALIRASFNAVFAAASFALAW